MNLYKCLKKSINLIDLIVPLLSNIVSRISKGVIILLITISLTKIINYLRFVNQFKHLPQERTNFFLGDLYRIALRSSWKNLSPFTTKSNNQSRSSKNKKLNN